jgi:hypothetical protein
MDFSCLPFFLLGFIIFTGYILAAGARTTRIIISVVKLFLLVRMA